MKILKEEKIEEYECPKCKSKLEFDINEQKDNKTFWRFFLYIFGLYDPNTGNGWFECSRCNKRYLIKNYANCEGDEDE